MAVLAGVVAAAVALASAAGCYWLRYHDLLRTHVDLIEQLSVDAGASLAAGHGVLQPADIERLRYPLERAREFATISARRFGGEGSPDRPQSLVAFEELLGTYGDLVGDLDRLRVADVKESDQQAVEAAIERIHAEAAAVRRAIDAEQ